MLSVIWWQSFETRAAFPPGHQSIALEVAGVFGARAGAPSRARQFCGRALAVVVFRGFEDTDSRQTDRDASSFGT
jgi:hypothetical protein